MKAYLISTGVLFVLMAAAHLFIVVKNYGDGDPDPWHVLAPAVVLLIAAAFSLWSFMLIRRKPTS